MVAILRGGPSPVNEKRAASSFLSTPTRPFAEELVARNTEFASFYLPVNVYAAQKNGWAAPFLSRRCLIISRWGRLVTVYTDPCVLVGCGKNRLRRLLAGPAVDTFAVP